MDSTAMLALLGMWFVLVSLILGFFAGARRIGGASTTRVLAPRLRRKARVASLRPPTRETV